MARIYKVTLTTEERQALDDIVSKGKHSAAKMKHANILLAVDESDGRVKRWDADIETYRHEVKVWQEERNRLGGSNELAIHARIKLKKLYPHI